MIDALTATVIGALLVAGVTAVVGLLWKMSQELAITKTTLVGIEKRFDDHAHFIELILERVLPEGKHG